jgi:hypothetical protein
MTEEMVTVEKGSHCPCEGGGMALAPNLVDLKNFQGYCPDCGQRVTVWLEGLLYRAPHHLPVKADTVSV